MPNITITLDQDLIIAGREYAKKHNTSLNALIRKQLEKTVKTEANNHLDECFRLMDEANVNSRGKNWKREDLYDV